MECEQFHFYLDDLAANLGKLYDVFQGFEGFRVQALGNFTIGTTNTRG